MGWLRRRKKIQQTSTAIACADEIIDTCWGLVARAEASKTEVVKWNPAVAAVLGVEPHPVARELVPHPRRDRVLAGEIRNCIAADRAATAELAAAGIVADHVDEIAVALIELRCSLAAARTRCAGRDGWPWLRVSAQHWRARITEQSTPWPACGKGRVHLTAASCDP